MASGSVVPAVPESLEVPAASTGENIETAGGPWTPAAAVIFSTSALPARKFWN